MENKEYCIKQLKLEDKEKILQAYIEYKKLYFSPFNNKFVQRIFKDGFFWGIYEDDKLICVTYTLIWKSLEFKKLNARWEIEDLFDFSVDNCLICGYISGNLENKKIYRDINLLWHLQGIQEGAQTLIFYTPANFYTDFQTLFSCGFFLCGLRGLDNLVAHYILAKGVKRNADFHIFGERTECLLNDTYNISKLCEKGWRANAIEEDKMIFIKGGHLFD